MYVCAHIYIHTNTHMRICILAYVHSIAINRQIVDSVTYILTYIHTIFTSSNCGCCQLQFCCRYFVCNAHIHTYVCKNIYIYTCVYACVCVCNTLKITFSYFRITAYLPFFAVFLLLFFLHVYMEVFSSSHAQQSWATQRKVNKSVKHSHICTYIRKYKAL